jgi:hypothetical protein
MDECDFAVCVRCYLDMSDDEVKQNIVSGGRFYPRTDRNQKRIGKDSKEDA